MWLGCRGRQPESERGPPSELTVRSSSPPDTHPPIHLHPSLMSLPSPQKFAEALLLEPGMDVRPSRLVTDLEVGPAETMVRLPLHRPEMVSSSCCLPHTDFHAVYILTQYRTIKWDFDNVHSEESVASF